MSGAARAVELAERWLRELHCDARRGAAVGPRVAVALTELRRAERAARLERLASEAAAAVDALLRELGQ